MVAAPASVRRGYTSRGQPLRNLVQGKGPLTNEQDLKSGAHANPVRWCIDSPQKSGGAVRGGSIAVRTLPKVGDMQQECEDSIQEITRLDEMLSTCKAAGRERRKVGEESVNSTRELLLREATATEEQQSDLVHSLRERGLIPEAVRPSTQGGLSVSSSRPPWTPATRASTAPSHAKRRPNGFSASSDWDPRRDGDWWCEASRWAEGSTWWGWAHQDGADQDSNVTSTNAALIWAAEGGCIGTCRILLAQAADANSKCRRDMTSLMLAAANGHLQVVELLLDYKADANAVDIRGKAAIHRAVYQGHADVVRCLLQHGGVQLAVRTELLKAARLYRHDGCVAELMEPAVEIELVLVLVPTDGAERVSEPVLDEALKLSLAQLVARQVRLGVRPEHLRFRQLPVPALYDLHQDTPVRGMQTGLRKQFKYD